MDSEVQSSNTAGVKQQLSEISNGALGSQKSSLLDALMQYVDKAGDSINRFVLQGFDLWFLFQSVYYFDAT